MKQTDKQKPIPSTRYSFVIFCGKMASWPISYEAKLLVTKMLMGKYLEPAFVPGSANPGVLKPPC